MKGQARQGARSLPAEQRAPTGSRSHHVIGWSELADLPDWGISRLRAKIDTGARTSALHVEDLVYLTRDRVSFDVRLHRRQPERRVRVVAPVTRRGRVRSSSGHYETRIFVQTRFQIGPVIRPIEISLVDREGMLFRMLIGRIALAGFFLVDPGQRRIFSRRRSRRSKK